MTPIWQSSLAKPRTIAARSPEREGEGEGGREGGRERERERERERKREFLKIYASLIAGVGVALQGGCHVRLARAIG